MVLVKAKGDAKPNHEIKYIDYYRPGSDIRISGITREIIEKYYKLNKNRPFKIKNYIKKIINFL